MKTPPLPIPPALEKTLTKQFGVVRSLGPQIEYLQTLAEVCPPIAGSVEELSTMHAALDQLCRVGLGGQVADLTDNSRG